MPENPFISISDIFNQATRPAARPVQPTAQRQQRGPIGPPAPPSRETREQRRARLQREEKYLANLQVLSPEQEARFKTVQRALSEYGVRPTQRRQSTFAQSLERDPAGINQRRQDISNVQAANATVPGTPDNLQRLSTQAARAHSLTREQQDLLNSVMFIRRRVPMQGGGTRKVTARDSEAIIKSAVFDKDDFDSVLRMLKDPNQIGFLQKEVQDFRDERELASRRAGNPASMQMSNEPSDRLARRTQATGALEQARREGNQIPNPNMAGIGAVIDNVTRSTNPLIGMVNDNVDLPEVTRRVQEGAETMGKMMTMASPVGLGAIGIDTALTAAGQQPRALRATQQFTQSAQRGFTGAIADAVDIPTLLGSKEWAQLSESIRKGVDGQEKLDDTFANELGQGLGSMAAYVIPGAGAAALTAKLPAIARWVGAATSGILEAGGNAAPAFRTATQNGVPIEEARQRAFQSLVADAAGSAILNRFGIFGDEAKGLLPRFRSSFLEGVQEAGQETLSQYVETGQIDPSTGRVGKAWLLGSILGGLVGGGGSSALKESPVASDVEVNKPINRLTAEQFESTFGDIQEQPEQGVIDISKLGKVPTQETAPVQETSGNINSRGAKPDIPVGSNSGRLGQNASPDVGEIKQANAPTIPVQMTQNVGDMTQKVGRVGEKKPDKNGFYYEFIPDWQGYRAVKRFKVQDGRVVEFGNTRVLDDVYDNFIDDNLPLPNGYTRGQTNIVRFAQLSLGEQELKYAKIKAARRNRSATPVWSDADGNIVSGESAYRNASSTKYWDPLNNAARAVVSKSERQSNEPRWPRTPKRVQGKDLYVFIRKGDKMLPVAGPFFTQQDAEAAKPEIMNRIGDGGPQYEGFSYGAVDSGTEVKGVLYPDIKSKGDNPFTRNAVEKQRDIENARTAKKEVAPQPEPTKTANAPVSSSQVPKTGTQKEPWQMTQKEFIASNPRLEGNERDMTLQEYRDFKGYRSPLDDHGRFKAPHGISKSESRRIVAEQARLSKLYDESLSEYNNLKSSGQLPKTRTVAIAEYAVERDGAHAANYRATHKRAIRLALTQGKPVPPEVLADYPDLQSNNKQVQKESEKPAPSNDRQIKYAGKLDKSEKIEDVGEKIGGARKDLAERREAGKRERKKSEARYRILEPDSKSDKYTLIDSQGRFGGVIGEFSTREKAEVGIKIAIFAQKHSFGSTYGENPEHYIYRTVGGHRVKIKGGFASKEEAQSYAVENIDEILGIKTTFGEADLETSPTTNRTGPRRRSGNVTPQKLKDEFGLRGVEFGNWNNQSERQVAVNDAFDALADLAALMNVDPKVIGLGGNLSLAFGARGHGLSGARAHFEPERVVINLTKEKGFGALAHEWFHALDQSILRSAVGGYVWENGQIKGVRKGSANYATEAASIPALPKKVAEALMELKYAIRNKTESDPEAKARAEKSVEKFLDELRTEADSTANYILNPSSYAERKGGSKLTADDRLRVQVLIDMLKTGNYPVEQTVVSGSGINAKFAYTNDILKELSTLTKKATGRSHLYADSLGLIGQLGTKMRQVDRAREKAETTTADATKYVPTEYVKNAREIDRGRASTYWAEPIELAARAFQAYVADKSGESNSYLDYGSRNEFYEHKYMPWADDQMRPYPEGAERKRIVEAMDKLVKALGEQSPRTTPDILASKKVTGVPGLDTILVDGKERPTTNSKGQPIHSTEEGIRRFWKWFGDSKVVDEQGRPLVVYHGSNASGFSKFVAKEVGMLGDFGKGFYFTDRPSYASLFAAKNGGGVYAVYLKIESPASVRDVYNMNGIYDRIVAARNGRGSEEYSTQEYFRERGDDGIHVTAPMHEMSGGTDAQQFFIAFDPNQIKSATGNKGTFDSNNPSILASPVKKPQGYSPIAITVAPIKTDKVIRTDEITFDIDKEFGKAVKGTSPKGTLGAHLPQNGVNYVRFGTDFITEAHELAHKIDSRLGLTVHVPSEVMQELRDGRWDGTIVDNTKPEHYDAERFAQFFAMFIANPDAATQLAPKSVAWLGNSLSVSQRKAIKGFSDKLRMWYGLEGEARVASSFTDPNKYNSKPISKLVDAVKDGGLVKLETMFTDEYAAIEKLAKMAGSDNASASKNPLSWLRRIPYVQQIFIDGINNGMVDFKTSSDTGTALARGTKPLKDLINALSGGKKGKRGTEEFEKNYSTFTSYMASRRHVHFAERQGELAEEAIEFNENLNKERAADLIKRKEARINAKLHEVIAKSSFTGQNLTKFKAEVTARAQEEIDQFAKKVYAAEKSANTRFANRARAEAVRKGELSGIAEQKRDGISSVENARKEVARIESLPNFKQIKEAADIYAEFGDWALRQLVWSGKLSEDQASKIRMANPYWFHIDRALDDDASISQYAVDSSKSLLSSKETIQNLKGSQKSKEDILASLLNHLQLTLAESMRNKTLSSLTDLMVDTNREWGVFGEIRRIPTERGVKEENPIKIYRNGELEYWKIDDKNLRETLSRVASPRSDVDKVFIDALALPARVTQAMIVKAPPFIAFNVIRDTVSRGTLSKHTGKMGVFEAAADIMKRRSKYINDMYGSLALPTNPLDALASPQKWGREQRKVLNELTGNENIILKSLKETGKLYNALAERAESANRKAEFDAAFKFAKKEGMNEFEASIYASNAARETTTDFRKNGQVTRTLGRIAPFLPAQVAGMRTEVGAMGRDNGKYFAKYASKIAIYGLLMVGMEELWAEVTDSKNDLDSLSPYHRMFFWNLRLGEHWIRIPKGHTVGTIVTLAEQTIASLATGNTKPLEGMKDAGLQSVMPLDLDSPMGGWTPAAETFFNYEFARQKNIVPSYEAKIPLSERDGTKFSSGLGQGLGHVLQADPRKVDYFVNKVFGHFGRIATDATSIKDSDDATSLLGRVLGVGPAKISPMGNVDVTWVEREMSKHSVRGTYWSSLKKAYYEAKTGAERTAAERALISYAKKVRETKLSGDYESDAKLLRSLLND